MYFGGLRLTVCPVALSWLKGSRTKLWSTIVARIPGTGYCNWFTSFESKRSVELMLSMPVSVNAALGSSSAGAAFFCGIWYSRVPALL